MKTTTIQSYSGDIYERQETEHTVSFRRIAKKRDPNWEPLAQALSTQETIDQLRSDLSTAREALRVMGEALRGLSQVEPGGVYEGCDLIRTVNSALSHPSVVKAMKEGER